MSEKNTHGTFCWNELCTNNVDEARDFFTSLLGWTTSEMPMENMTYTMFNAGDTAVGGMFKITPEMGDMPPHWMAYIAVDDVDAVAAKVEGLGGKICVPPTDIPDVGRFCVLTDPTGAAISLITMTSGE